MQNPIHPTPDRPLPLPDSILLDGWWIARDDGPDRIGAAQEGEALHDRHHASNSDAVGHLTNGER